MAPFKSTQADVERIQSRNIIAAISSIIPGLGHIYKAQYAAGIGYLVVSPFFILAGAFVGFATAGLGLFIPLFFMIAVGWHAYQIEDRRHHLGGIL